MGMAVEILGRTEEGPDRVIDWQLHDPVPPSRLPVDREDIDDEDRRRA
jgi:hypothetical protein